MFRPSGDATPYPGITVASQGPDARGACSCVGPLTLDGSALDQSIRLSDLSLGACSFPLTPHLLRSLTRFLFPPFSSCFSPGIRGDAIYVCAVRTVAARAYSVFPVLLCAHGLQPGWRDEPDCDVGFVRASSDLGERRLDQCAERIQQCPATAPSATKPHALGILRACAAEPGTTYVWVVDSAEGRFLRVLDRDVGGRASQ